LREHNLRLYFTGQVISQVGTWMQLLALPWLVLHLTHSGAAVGIVTGIQFAPILIGGAWSGVLIDRLDKRRVLFVTTTLAGLVALALSAVVFVRVDSIGLITVLAFLGGAVNAVDNPARRALVPELVEPGDVTNAVALNNAVFTSARVVGPAIAGVLIATVGIGWCFLLNAVSFLAVLVALEAMRPGEFHPAPRITKAKGQLREGLRYAWSTPIVRLALLMTAVIGTLSFNYQVVLPLLAKESFHASAGQFGIMYAVTGVGSLVGALIAAHRGRVSGRVMGFSAILFGVAMTGAAIAPTLTVECIVLVPMGAAGMMFFSMASGACQDVENVVMRGRVTALFSVAFIGSTPIGSPIVGAVAQVLGPRYGLAIGAAAALATGVAALSALRRARTAVSRSDAAVPLVA
jgi:MFS family permease